MNDVPGIYELSKHTMHRRKHMARRRPDQTQEIKQYADVGIDRSALAVSKVLSKLLLYA